MITMKIIGSVFHLAVQLVLLPAQIVLTMLICMMNFAGGVFDFIFGLIGGFIILAGLSCLFMSPVEWILVIEAMVAGMVIGSFPRMIRYFGETVLVGMKGFLSKQPCIRSSRD